MFVAFAPKENPTIAIAVVVENAGYGGTWGGPIARILMEKYLNDTLRPERLKKVEEIANANLMPSYLERLQYIEDSIRAFKWFEMTKDSAYLRDYVLIERSQVPASLPIEEKWPPVFEWEAILPEEKYFKNRPLA